MDLNQYDIILVNLDPTIGSEIRKTRPCLVISPNEMNRNLNTIIIAPITSTSRPYPTRIALAPNGKVTGFVVIDQIRTVDRQRVIKKMDDLPIETIEMVKQVLHETFVA